MYKCSLHSLGPPQANLYKRTKIPSVWSGTSSCDVLPALRRIRTAFGLSMLSSLVNPLVGVLLLSLHAAISASSSLWPSTVSTSSLRSLDEAACRQPVGRLIRVRNEKCQSSREGGSQNSKAALFSSFQKLSKENPSRNLLEN